MPRNKGTIRHGKHHLPRSVKGNWIRAFFRLKKRLENRKEEKV